MQKSAPFFSIGIPAYKDVFLEKCIQSILDQTYTNFELIIVNDCSPNDLTSIVEKFDDQRISYFINEENTGAEKVVLNWNKCLDRATGDFFVLMGDDDMMAPEYLEEFAGLINKYPDLDVYHCRTMIIDENDTPKILTTGWPEYETIYDNIWHRLTEKRYQYISDFMYRTSHLKEHGGFFYLPMAWGSDDITAYRACGNKGIAHTNKPVFKYRSNSFSITSTGNQVTKMGATIQYFNWISNLLNQSKPINIAEIVIFEDLRKNYDRYFEVKRINILVVSLKTETFKTFFMWMRFKKKFHLSTKEILYSVVLAVKSRLLN